MIVVEYDSRASVFQVEFRPSYNHKERMGKRLSASLMSLIGSLKQVTK